MLMTFAFDQVITWVLPGAIGLAGYALLLVGFFMLTRAALKVLGPMDSILRMNIGKRIRLGTWIMGAGFSLLVLRELMLFMVAALATGGVAVGAGNFWSYEDRGGQASASASSEADTVVATAGGVSITLGELQEELMHLQQSKVEHLQLMEQIASGEFQEMGEETEKSTDFLEALHNLGLKWGDDNVALSGLIEDHVLYQKAVELGYEATEEELEENIEWARDLYERGEWSEYNQVWVESVGADHYFENIYPALVARSMATEKLYEGLGKEVGTRYYDGEPPLRYQFEEAVLAEAEIIVLESEDHSATLDGVLGFLGDVRETYIARWQEANGY